MILRDPALRGRRAGGRAALLILGVLGLIALAASLWFLYSRRPTVGGSILERAALLAPSTTQVLVAVDGTRPWLPQDVREQAWRTLSEGQLRPMLDTLEQRWEVNLEEELKAWALPAGAVLMAPAEGDAGLLQSALKASSAGGAAPFRQAMLLQLSDPAKAREALAALSSKEGGYTEESVEGVALHHPRTAGEGPAWAIREDLLLVGLTADDLRHLLSGGQGSLATQGAYREAMASLPDLDGALIWVDLQGALQGAPIPSLGSAELTGLIEPLRHLVFKAGLQGRTLRTDWRLALTPPRPAEGDGGDAAPEALFRPSHNLSMASLRQTPADVDLYMGLNLKLLYEVLYRGAGAFPQGLAYRDFPEMLLRQKGIDLKQDILGNLTGELSYSVEGLARIEAERSLAQGQEDSPEDLGASFRDLPIVLTLGWTGLEKVDALISKVGLKPVLDALPSQELDGATIRQAGPATFAMTAEGLTLGVNKEPKALAACLGRKSPTLDSLESGQSALEALGTEKKAFLLLYYNMGKVYGEITASLKERGASPAQVALFELMSQRYGVSWVAAAVTPEGLTGTGTTDLR